MNEVVITTDSIEKARVQGASALNVSEADVDCEILDQIGRRMRVRVFQKAQASTRNSQEIDQLLETLDEKVGEIEMQSFLSGFSSEDLETRGLTSAKPLRSSDGSLAKQEGRWWIPSGVEYMPCAATDLDDPLLLSAAEPLQPCEPGTVVAWCDASGLKPDMVFASADSGLTAQKRESGGTEFVSARVGRLLVVAGRLHLLARDVDGRFDLKVEADHMQAIISLRPPRGQGKPVDYAQVAEALHAANVVFGIHEDILREAIAKSYAEGISIDHVVAAEGKRPIAGEDARANFLVPIDTSHPQDDFTVLPDGRVDYRKRAMIPMVKSGDIIAEILPAKPGQDGTDVHGKAIKASKVEQKALYCGEGTNLSKDGSQVIATIDGQVSLNDRQLCVFAMYTVQGDVDFHTGNIEFNGNVTIHGNVFPGFEVRAKGDIVITENMESAIVVAGRDLTVGGGIIGAGREPVRAGRHLTALHMQNAWVEAEGDVVLRNTALHSRIDCSGRIVALDKKGALVGGESNAMAGLEVKNLGNVAGTPTRTSVGQDFLVKRRLEEANQARVFMEESLKKIENYLAPLMKHLEAASALSSEQKQRLSVILAKRRELLQNLNMLQGRIHSLEHTLSMPSSAHIRVIESMFLGVRAFISGVPFIPDGDMKRVLLELDAVQGKILSRSA